MEKRLVHFINDVCHMSVSEFADKIGSSKFYIYQLTSNKTNRGIGMDFILKIKEKYPALNLNWLIYNQGDVMLDDASVSINNDYKDCPFCKDKDEMINVLRESMNILNKKYNM